MAGIGNNLYPPIFLKSYMPAFIKGQGCRIYFSLSQYNAETDIKADCVQIIVQNQKTNQSVLKKSLYPSGIKLGNLKKDSSLAERQDKYYIELTNNDIEGSNGFSYNQYYKVQIRFTANLKTITKPTNSQKLDSWLNNNLENFSQWSTVVLIKPISKPKITSNQFNFNSSDLSLIPNNIVTIQGVVKHGEKSDHEGFKSYKVLLYDNNGLLIEESEEKYFYDSNQIFYNCKYNFLPNISYKVKIQILTSNLYFMEVEANFQVQFIIYDNFEAIIQAKMDTSEGCMVITLNNNSLLTLGTNIVIRRSSSKDNFLYWEDMYTTLIPANSFLNLVWKDYTIENGIWYKYSVVKRNKENFRSTSVEIRNPIFSNCEDIFLTTSQSQLKIRFNPQVSNYSRVVSQSLTQTIGSKYPFIRRNGKVGYRTFSISGTISYFSDINQNLMHSSKEELYGTNASLYNNYNKENNITLYNDIVQQKEFREKVIDFLYKNTVKLYRSATQGNILVKLMNISFTPNTTLSRQIYDFTCTAYEIDEFNYENCIKYSIQDEGAYVNEDRFFITRYGQLMAPNQDRYYEDTKEFLDTVDSYYFGKQELLTNVITPKFKKLQSNNIQIEGDHLTYLRIQLTSNPYSISYSGGILAPADDSNDSNIICSGHIVNINGQSIVIGPEGIYELSGDNISITSLNFVSSREQGVIDFQVVLEEKEKRNLTDFKDYEGFSTIGQLWGSFSMQQSLTSETIYSKIVNRYTFSNPSKQQQQQVQKIKGLRIISQPGTIVYVKENQDTGYDKHILNETGVLEFFDDETNIKGIYFDKPVLKEIDKETLLNKGLANDQFYDTGEVITLDTFKNPKNNYVYYFAPINLNKKVLKLTQEEQVIIETLQIPINSDNSTTDDLYSSELIQKRILGWKTNNQKVEELQQPKTLGLKYSGFERYIFYNGNWYNVNTKDGNDEAIVVNISNVQAIIDYYCDILRKRY